MSKEWTGSVCAAPLEDTAVEFRDFCSFGAMGSPMLENTRALVVSRETTAGVCVAALVRSVIEGGRA